MNNEKITSLPIPQDALQNETYEEELRQSEERLRALFQKAYYEYHADDFLPRKPLDFSFMDETVRIDKPALWRPWVLRAAALLLVCMSLTGVMYSFVNSQTAYAARFHLEKALYQISGKYYASDPDSEYGDQKISTRITSAGEIPDAVRFMPELYLLEKIPDGWTLDQLILTKTLHGDRYAEYTFTGSQGKTFCIDEQVLLPYSQVSPGMEGESVTLPHREVILQTDEYMETQAVCFIEENVLVTIGGDLSEEELLQIADGLQQKK